jgi:hypothetical protein
MTATEKYNAVLEGKMQEAEFVRQMRLAFPQYITQWNGYKDSVQILKSRGMIFENKLKDVRPIQDMADNFSLDAIERGIDMELEAAGIDPTGSVSKEDYVKAKQKVLLNLQKDQQHYYNLISGESAKVDKNDKMKETKRGKLESDTFNAMKKATLKEGVEEADAIPTEPGVPGERASNHDRKMALRNIIDYLTKDGHPDSGHKVSTDDALSFIKTHKDDIYSGEIDANDIADVWGNYDEYEAVNRDDVGEVMGINRKGEKQPETDGSDAAKYKRMAKGLEEDEEEYLAKKDAAIKKAMGKEDEVEEAVNAYTPGDMFSTDFDYEGMLKAGLKVRINTPVDTMQKIYDSFEDVNYHRENAHLGNVIDAVKDGDKGAALDALKSFRREIKNTMSDIFEGAFPVRERDENYVPRNGVVKERVATLDNFISLIQDKAGDSGFPEEEEAMEVIEAIADHYGIKIQIGGLVGEEEDDGLRDDPRVDKHGNEEPEDGESSFGEAKGKDHDGDGDIDKDDYMAAKDKAIKKAMGKKNEMVKENLKAIISKVLEEGTINEAATQELARIADDYAGFEGMKGAILDLQNLVSDIEAYYDKTREKIQKVYDTLGEIKNEEGLKVGGFLAPAIETAFMKDLRPVTKQGFTKGLDQPKVRVISQKDIDAHNSGERPLGEDEFTPQPKETVFTPNI